MTEDTTAVVPAPTGRLSLGGSSDLRADQLILPRIKVVQAMSQERSHGLAQEGDFFNTLTQESYGPELKFLPLLAMMNRVLLVRDEKLAEVNKQLKETGVKLDKSPSTLRDRSLDMVHGVGDVALLCESCPLSLWQGREIPPFCTEVYNVAALTEFGDLVILQFSKSSAKAGKRVFSMIRLGSAVQAPWSRYYVAKTHSESNPKGTFAVPVVTKTPEIPAPELLKACIRWAQQLEGIGPIDVTPTDDEEPADDTDLGGEPTGDDPF
jgi:hypothetical protein